jgi:hypothetical protein
VENLLMERANPVEQTTRKFIFAQIVRESTDRNAIEAHSYFVSLDRQVKARRIALLLLIHPKNYLRLVRQSFERIIAGRCYLIEVAMVDEKRWRAGILKLPGVPAAMMPFYGTTPDEAATKLTDWLGRALQHHASTA